ncbi:hypothetical protein AURDEDRAFT_115224 [Auricularia subglabra TFB-10046 SS5]|nr:hypothetical protein AURDEDRAFT_115224 [Auricularia subglabra TFB-10046 SS5]
MHQAYCRGAYAISLLLKRASRLGRVVVALLLADMSGGFRSRDLFRFLTSASPCKISALPLAIKMPVL